MHGSMEPHFWARRFCWRMVHLAFRLFICCVFLLSQLRSLFSFSTLKLKKLPRHLAIIIDSEDALAHLPKVVQLLQQLAQLGLQHVSLYDMKGSLKSVLADSFGSNSTVRFYSHDVVSNGLPIQGVQCAHMEPCSKHKAYGSWQDTGIVCPCQRRDQLAVEVLCLRDGKQAIVRAARNVCLKSLQSGVLSSLKEEDIDTSLRETGGVGPDPDFLLLFSDSRCLLGFPPWRLRLTEIQHMGSIRDMTEKSLFVALDEFSYKHQRYGK